VTGLRHRSRGGAEGAEFALVIAASLYCGYGIAQGILAILLDAGRYPSVTPNVLVAVVVFGSTGVVLAACLPATTSAPAPKARRRRRMPTACAGTWSHFRRPLTRSPTTRQSPATSSSPAT
jgi:hypothetical protein